MDDRSPSGINDYAARLIRFKARTLSRRRAFARDDRADIEQDLWLDLIERLPKFDPAKATLNTFIALVVDRKIASLVRNRLAEKRSLGREAYSLDDPVLDADGRVVRRHETTPEAAYDPTRLRDLERDTAQVLAGVSDDLRAVALGIAIGTRHSAGAEVGLSRRAVPKAVEQLREAFRDSALDEYI